MINKDLKQSEYKLRSTCNKFYYTCNHNHFETWPKFFVPIASCDTTNSAQMYLYMIPCEQMTLTFLGCWWLGSKSDCIAELSVWTKVIHLCKWGAIHFSGKDFGSSVYMQLGFPWEFWCLGLKSFCDSISSSEGISCPSKWTMFVFLLATFINSWKGWVQHLGYSCTEKYWVTQK